MDPLDAPWRASDEAKKSSLTAEENEPDPVVAFPPPALSWSIILPCHAVGSMGGHDGATEIDR